MRGKRNSNGIFYVVISLFAVFSILFSGISILYAYAATQSINVAGDYNYYEAEGQPIQPTEEDINLGAISGNEVYQPMQFHDTVLLSPGIREPLTLRPTTTRNLYSGTLSRDSIATYTNSTGKNLLCDIRTLLVYFDDPLTELTGSLAVGTTTFTTGGSLTATRTVTLMASTTIEATEEFSNAPLQFQAESRLGSYFRINDYGNSSTTLFLLKNSESLVANMDIYGASSTEDYDTHGMDGNLSVTCWFANE
jgi:hypothetical protein